MPRALHIEKKQWAEENIDGYDYMFEEVAPINLVSAPISLYECDFEN